MIRDKWQQEVMDTVGDICVNTGRQVGKTFTFSNKIGKFMIDNPKKKIIVVSLTEDQAQLIIIMVLDYLEKKCKSDIQKGKNKPTKSRIFLRNGSSVISRPVGNTGDAVRGFTGDVLYIDEASGMPEMMWKAAMPTLATTGGQIWMSSTPRGKYQDGKGSNKNFFYKCFENLEDRWKVFTINTEEVYKNRTICESWDKEKAAKAIKFIANQKAILADIEYRQEYMAEFLDDARQWFDDKIIRKCMTVRRPPLVDKNWTTGMGNDIARMGEDQGTYEVFRMTGDRLIQLDNQISNKQDIVATSNQITGLHEKYDFLKIFIDDEGSLGKGVYDILMNNDNIKRRIKGISNSKRVKDEFGKEKGIKKTELYVKLLAMMEKGEIDLLEDESIFQSLKSVQYAYTNDSRGTRHLKIFGHDTHICEGITRATELLKYKDLNPTIYSIKI